MISKQKCLFYFVGDQAFKSLEEAQKADLKKIMCEASPLAPLPQMTHDEFLECVSSWLLANSTAIVD